MVPILGKPVLEYLIAHLARHSIREIMINAAFNHYKIENYFGDGRRWGVEIGYSFEGAREHGAIVPRAMGSAGEMRKIQDFGGFFDETTLVMCSDAIIDLDISAAPHEHRHKQALASVVTLDVHSEEVQNYGIVVADESGRVRSFQEKPSPQEARSTAASTGIYIFEHAVLDLVPPGRAFDIGNELFPLLVERDLPFYAQKRFFSWIDIGRLSDYWMVLQRVLRGEIVDIEMPGQQVRPGVWVGLNTSIDWNRVHIEGPVYVGSGTRIEAGAKVMGPTWIVARKPFAGQLHGRAQRAVRIHPHWRGPDHQRTHHVTPVLRRPARSHPVCGRRRPAHFLGRRQGRLTPSARSLRSTPLESGAIARATVC